MNNATHRAAGPADQALPGLAVIGAAPIRQWIDSHPKRIFDLVSQAYLAYARGHAVNPDSYFLRFPDDTRNRIIALPCSMEQQDPIAGIKWIASFPDNIHAGLDRASALFILNDRRTGYPLACLEGSLISAARTAVSAVIGAHYLHGGDRHIARLGVVGCGLIALNVIAFFQRLGWRIDALSLIDTDIERARAFSRKSGIAGIACEVGTEIGAIADCDMVLFATTASRPHVSDPALFSHNPTVLHLSLRDLSPAIVLMSQNVVDDVEHSLKANTSLHLAEQETAGRAFIAGDIAQLIEARFVPDANRPRVFSPFGMGILDLSVAQAIWQDSEHDDVLTCPAFFPTPYSTLA